MANLILANKREVKSGSQMWHVYRLSENTKSDEFFFAQPIKALRYAFLLRKRSGAILPKAIYTKLMADVETSKAQAEQAAPQESAPQAEQAQEPNALAKAFEQMKAKHPDALLLFRMADFYVSYADDAKQVSEICGVTLTRTNKAKDITAQQAAFPAAALDTYLPQLVRAGKRVAICDTLQSAAPQHSSSKLDSAFGLHDCCDEPSAAQESAPQKATRKRSTKKESK